MLVASYYEIQRLFLNCHIIIIILVSI